jgi:hypothetical protein
MIDLEQALRWNPFEGDFGSSLDRTFKDKIVKFLKERPCCCCRSTIRYGTYGRAITKFWDGDGVMSYAYCTECTEAMAISDQDAGKSWEARINFGE